MEQTSGLCKRMEQTSEAESESFGIYDTVKSAWEILSYFRNDLAQWADVVSILSAFKFAGQ